MSTHKKKVPQHPLEHFLRMERMPHIWCPGCGIGTALSCFLRALNQTGVDQDKVVVVSGIGCTGRIAGYVRLDSFHTTHGRAIPFATGVKLANPELTVVVFSGDGDLFAIGGNHFIHAARRNVDIKVLCINNFIYGMTGGQSAPTTPLGSVTSTSPYGSLESSFNLSYLAESSGAVFVARWSSFHTKMLSRSISEAITKPGFSFIEIVSPCPTLYSRYNRLGYGPDILKYYLKNSRVNNGADTKEIPLELGKEMVVGKFVDIEKPTFMDNQKYQRRKNEKRI